MDLYAGEGLCGIAISLGLKKKCVVVFVEKDFDLLSKALNMFKEFGKKGDMAVGYTADLLQYGQYLTAHAHIVVANPPTGVPSVKGQDCAHRAMTYLYFTQCLLLANLEFSGPLHQPPLIMLILPNAAGKDFVKWMKSSRVEAISP